MRTLLYIILLVILAIASFFIGKGYAIITDSIETKNISCVMSNKQLETRYQYYGKNGIEWTKWFPIDNNTVREPWQLKNKLKNEYREISKTKKS